MDGFGLVATRADKIVVGDVVSKLFGQAAFTVTAVSHWEYRQDKMVTLHGSDGDTTRLTARYEVWKRTAYGRR